MKREEIEVAIHNLTRLLDSGEESERAFQTYFEDHPCVFQSMSFVRAHARPRLPLPEEEATRRYLEPDFLLERLDGMFEIIDLKTPQEKVVREAEYRDKFYAKIEEYLSQVENYSEYFNDSRHRKVVQKQLSLDVQSSPHAMLIVGRDEGLDKRLLHKMLARRSTRIRIWTFDEVLSHLRMHYVRHFNRGDGLQGVALYLAIAVERGDVKKSRYVYDQGLSVSKNRFSVILMGDSLAFDVRDDNGKQHRISAPLSDRVLNRDEILFVSACFGAGENETFLQLRFNNTIVAELIIANSVTLDVSVDRAVATFGQDIEETQAEGTPNEAIEFGGGVSFVNRKSSRSFVSDGHGNSIDVSGSLFWENAGGNIEVSGVGGQSVVIHQCNFQVGEELAVLNHCVTSINANEVWWGESGDSLDRLIYDRSDEQNLGRVSYRSQASMYPLPDMPQLSALELSRMTSVPAGFRSAESIFQVQGAPPSISAAWNEIKESWVAGYRLQISEVIPTYHERVAVETDKGYSPIDAGKATSIRVGGLKPKTQYEILLWAYDENGNESLSAKPLLITTKT